MRITLFKRRKPGEPAPQRQRRVARPELPYYVENEIEDAQLFEREPDDHGPRVMCQFSGMQAFIYTDEAAGKCFARMWPELSPEEGEEAVRRLRRHIKTFLHETALAARGGPWATRY